MARCDKGYDYCQDCANQEIAEECDVCDDGDNFDPLDIEDAQRALNVIFLKELA